MKLTNDSTYKDFQKTNFYKLTKNHVMTQAPTGREPFTEQQAENMMNSFYWRSHFGESLEGIQ
tara:strand:- start:396 stop:584 length:189 start_codon:yes stop_codon:yes gene_type:complete